MARPTNGLICGKDKQMTKDIPAFPRPYSGATQYAQEGMGLRDYFAAKAMQGAFTNPTPSSVYELEYIAEKSYEMANAMMKAREQ